MPQACIPYDKLESASDLVQSRAQYDEENCGFLKMSQCDCEDEVE